MNCANHPDVAAAAYCRTCGKALCSACTRTVRGVIYCENCLADRLEGVQPPQTTYQQIMDQGLGMKVQPLPAQGPHPVVAGILGAIPFGIGAVYNGQYAKALAHLLIFVGLIWGADHTGDLGGTLFGLGIAFFIFYQIFDAVRTAKAIQMGQPAPDPLGLGQALGAGEKVDTSQVPIAAIILIGLGILFLLNTTGLFNFDFDRIWPVFLILLGGWLLARRFGYLGHQPAYDCARCCTRGLMGPAVLITVGALSLLDAYTRVGWDRTWPVLLVVIGAVKFAQSSASAEGHIDNLPPAPGGPAPGPVQPPASEVHNG